MESCTAAEKIDLQILDGILAAYDAIQEEDLIPIMQAIQEQYGFLPPEILTETSKRTGIPVSRIYGVATFYEQFHLEPRGKHIVKCCRGTACHVSGAQEIIDTISQELGVEDGGTTEDLRYTFETVACLGTCFLAPVIMVDNDYFGNLKPGEIKSILEGYS